MRKLTFVSAMLVALVATSIAVAHGIEGAKTAKAVAGTFTATGASTSTRTCTTAEGKSISVTDGRYTGVASGDPDLAGNITLRARSVVNTTDNVGTVEGQLRIDVANGKDTQAAYSAVYSGGSLAGLAVGRAHGPNARLIANLSATFSAATGFTNGKIGGGTTGGTAIELSGSSCRSSGAKPEKSEARGTVTAVSSSSITVAGLTCAVPAAKAGDVAKLAVNDRAEIHCSLSNGVNTLTRVEKKK
jgi:hypothetical protein